jgi:hypothetical protein
MIFDSVKMCFDFIMHFTPCLLVQKGGREGARCSSLLDEQLYCISSSKSVKGELGTMGEFLVDKVDDSNVLSDPVALVVNGCIFGVE